MLMKLSKNLLATLASSVIVFGISSCCSKNCKTAADELKDTETAMQTAAETEAAETATNDNAVIVLAENETLPKADGKHMIIDFNATWCGPCRQFAPNFESVAEKNAGKALFYSVDVDKHPALAEQYKVQGIPMVVFIAPDGTTDSMVGYRDESEFAAIVAAHLN